MAAVANNPAFAKKVGIKKSVGEEFLQADKGKKFKGGGMMDKKDLAQDKKMTKKAVSMHEKQLHGGKKSDLSALKKGGKVKKMAMGGPVLPPQASQQAVDAMSQRPAMPYRSVGSGGMQGLDQAAAMSGRDFTGMGRPVGMKKGGKVKKMAAGGRPTMPSQSNAGGAMRGLERAAAMSGKDFSGKGKPTGMKKGGSCKGYAKGGGIEVRGKTKGRII